MNLTAMNATFELTAPLMQSPELTRAYLYFLDVTFAVSLPIHLLILTLALFHTPNEMFCYKMTVSNTTFWSTLVLIWQCVVLRPVVLFPYSVGISFGPRLFISETVDAQLHFQILILFVINMLTAMIICFVSLCLYLIQSPISDLMRRKWAILTAISTHMSTTLFGWFLLNRIYKMPPTNQLRQMIVDGKVPKGLNPQYYQSLAATVHQTDGVVFGYMPGENQPFISLLTWTFFTTTVVVVLICLGLVMREIFKAINKSRSWRFKRNVFFMLASRTTIPLIFGFLPTIALTYLIWKDEPQLMLMGNALFAVANSQAMINCIATIAVFRPYRRTFLRITTTCMPEDTRRRLYQSTTTFVTKNALPTISTHWSRHATSARVAPFYPNTSRRNAVLERQQTTPN